jgi:hypothetical protein
VANKSNIFEELADAHFAWGDHKYMPPEGPQVVRPLGDLQIRRTEPNLPGILTFPFYYVRGKYRWPRGMNHLRRTLRRLPKRVKELGYGMRELGIAMDFTRHNIEQFSEAHAKSEREEREENVR